MYRCKVITRLMPVLATYQVFNEKKGKKINGMAGRQHVLFMLLLLQTQIMHLHK